MIELKNLFIVTAIGKTTTRIFKDMIVGDIVEISVVISRKTNRRGSYATYYSVKIIREGWTEGSEFSGAEIVTMEKKGFKLEVY